MELLQSIRVASVVILLSSTTVWAEDAPFKDLAGKWYALEGYHSVEVYPSGSGVFNLTVYDGDGEESMIGTLKSARNGRLFADVPEANLSSIEVEAIEGPDGQVRYLWKLGDETLTIVRPLKEGVDEDDFIGPWMQEISDGSQLQYSIWRFGEDNKGVLEEIGWDNARRIYRQSPAEDFQWKWDDGKLTIRRSLGLTRWRLPQEYLVIEYTKKRVALFDVLSGGTLLFEPATGTRLPSPPSGFQEVD